LRVAGRAAAFIGEAFAALKAAGLFFSVTAFSFFGDATFVCSHSFDAEQFVEDIPWIVNLCRSMLRVMKQRFESARALLAQNIKHKRAEAGLSQEALALSAEVDRTYVSQIERGVGNPSLLILCKLADVLAVDIEDLFVTGSGHSR
jgi:DNA-binding XRE family transcriptional regulator